MLSAARKAVVQTRVLATAARAFGAHAAPAVATKVAYPSGNLAAGAANTVPVTTVTLPNYGINYDHLHYVKASDQFHPEKSEPFSPNNVFLDQAGYDYHWDKYVENIKPSYEAALQSFPATPEGKKDAFLFKQFFEHLAYPEVVFAEDIAASKKDGALSLESLVEIPAAKSVAFKVSASKDEVPHPSLGVIDELFFPAVNGTKTQQINYKVGVLVSALCAGYVIYRGIAEVSELFEGFAHGHDHH